MQFVYDLLDSSYKKPSTVVEPLSEPWTRAFTRTVASADVHKYCLQVLFGCSLAACIGVSAVSGKEVERTYGKEVY